MIDVNVIIQDDCKCPKRYECQYFNSLSTYCLSCTEQCEYFEPIDIDDTNMLI